jgi:signal peptidase I
MTSTTHTSPKQEETNVVETLQSLIMAFGVAMTARAFVTEGFFIPTGSMAPTLMGQHVRLDSPYTGYEYPVDAQPYERVRAEFGPMWENVLRSADGLRAAERKLLQEDPRARSMTIDELNQELSRRTGVGVDQIRQLRGLRSSVPLYDPMISDQPVGERRLSDILRDSSPGDRVLVLKYLYAFQEPERWDVVVFKNPTNPTGDDASYIKRLVGLPNEQLLLLDGDVFTAPLGADRTQFTVARKPEYVQRTVWQAVHDSDFAPIDPAVLAQSSGSIWRGPPWEATGFSLGEKRNSRAWRSDSASRATLVWRHDVLKITDFATYNMPRLGTIENPVSVSDIRACAALDADDPAKLSTEFTLGTRKRTMRFTIAGGKASLAVEHERDVDTDPVETITTASVDFTPPAAGEPFEVEFWHVDQRLSMWVNGAEILHLDYTFASLEDRVQSSFNGYVISDYIRSFGSISAPQPKLAWNFEGSPLSLSRVRVDRDLYYRSTGLSTDPRNQFPQNGEPISGAAFACDFEKPAQVEADQFVMCGDNSCASKDSRLWGRPSPLVTATFGEDAPFIVPRPLLLGKAWCVYFPATVRPTDTLWRFMPDFGQLRFIR